jgi:hypothetical protein
MRYVVDIGCEQAVIEDENNERDAIRSALWQLTPQCEPCADDSGWKGYSKLPEVRIKSVPALTDAQLRDAAIDAVRSAVDLVCEEAAPSSASPMSKSNLLDVIGRGYPHNLSVSVDDIYEEVHDVYLTGTREEEDRLEQWLDKAAETAAAAVTAASDKPADEQWDAASGALDAVSAMARLGA